MSWWGDYRFDDRHRCLRVHVWALMPDGAEHHSRLCRWDDENRGRAWGDLTLSDRAKLVAQYSKTAREQILREHPEVSAA